MHGMTDERKIGFIQGVVWAAALAKEYDVNAEIIMKESGFSKEDFLKYADEHDLKILGLLESGTE